jgi:hypothetical protein
LLLHSEARRPSENQTERKNGVTNPNHGFVAQAQVRPFPDFLGLAEHLATAKRLELKGVRA